MFTFMAATGAISIFVMLVAIHWIWRSPYDEVIKDDRYKDRR